MRRKSTRNAQKASPEKPVKEAETTPKTRRSKRRKRSPTKSSDSEEEVINVTKRAPFEETPDTTTKSHSPSDEETSQEPVWKVTSSEDVPKGEIQKLKICLTRPTPDSPDKTKTRRSKSCSQTEDDATSSEDKTTTTTTRRTRSRGSPLVKADGISISSQEAVDEDVEDKKGKGKSKGKHKSKIEKSTHLTDSEIQSNNDISENVQVTPQSPSLDKPVDNENDYNKVDADDKQIDNAKTDSLGTIGEESNNSAQIAVASQSNAKIVVKDSDDEDDEPLSVIKKITKDEKQSVVHESKPDSSNITAQEEQTVNAETSADKPDEKHEQTNQEKAAESVEENASAKSEVKDTESAKEAVVEDIESVRETIVENTEAIVEKVESEKETVVENTEAVVEKVESEKETIVENTESVVEKVESEKETTSVKEAEPVEEAIVEDNKCVEETIVKTSESEKIVEETEAVKETITEEEKPQEESEPQEKDEHSIQEKSSDDSRIVLNAALNETGDVEMTDLTDDKYAPVKDPEAEEKPAEKAPIVVSSQENHEVVNEKTIRRRLKRDNELRNSESKETDQKEDAFGLKPPKRVKWANKQEEEFITKINLETIQSVYPQIDFPEEPDLNVEIQKERRKSTTSESSKKLERKVSVDYKSDNEKEKPTYETQNSVESSETTQEKEDNTNIIAFNRKISIVDDSASKLKPPPSPAKNPSSEVLFMTNLVRPFTLKQLKELLERTGKICEDGFWTDRIKSKCYVKYESAEEAEATRNALHGVQWPIGNGKKLIIDFATVEDLEQAKNPPAPPPTVPVEIAPTQENQEPANDKSKIEEKAARETNKRKIDGPVREWDIGKKDLQRDRSRSKERSRRHRKSPSPMDDFITRKQKKAEEAVPQKLMDDLFLKTKATPSIYWQPLSPDEISMKQQQRLVRMEEHKRRMAENTRGKGREMGRGGAFRRRYD